MTITIHATLTRCRHSQPLVVLDSAPFNGLEIRPHDLRRLALQLADVADMATTLACVGKRFRPTTVNFGEPHEQAQRF